MTTGWLEPDFTLLARLHTPEFLIEDMAFDRSKKSRVHKTLSSFARPRKRRAGGRVSEFPPREDRSASWPAVEIGENAGSSSWCPFLCSSPSGAPDVAADGAPSSFGVYMPGLGRGFVNINICMHAEESEGGKVRQRTRKRE